MSGRSRLRAGDWVEVRSKEEILATLGAGGRLESLPFMPEMFAYCGSRLQVVKRAHKTCDPPSGIDARRMPNAVHLAGVRCGGEAHGGCQAGCLIFWKDAWLKKVDDEGASPRTKDNAPVQPVKRGSTACTESQVFAAVYRGGADTPEPLYACQSTEVNAATSVIPWWDLRQYVEDVQSGNVRIGQLIAAFLFFLYHSAVHSGIGLGSALRWLYDGFQNLRGGTVYPWRLGLIPKGGRTPAAKLDLHVGETVKVRSYADILETLDADSKNRGMYFDGEHVPFCGGEFEVLSRIERIIDEKTGKMLRLKNDAIVLKDVECQARYSKCRRFCSRAIYPYWREIWLERAHANDCR